MTPRLLHVFSTFRVGGPQVRFVAFANHFGDRYRHAILAMDGAYDCLARVGEHIEVTRLGVPMRKGRTAANVLAFRRVLHRQPPDLLVTYNWGAIEWALANRPRLVPHIHIEDGFGHEEADRQILRRSLTRRVALAKSVVVMPSRTLVDVALKRWHLPASGITHIPNGIDCARFAAVLKRIPLPPGPGPVIGTIAALRREKNIERLLQAFQSVSERIPCRLVVAGDGPVRTELERLARATLPADSYLFTGHVEDVETVYASLDVFALSSDTEQMPTSLMEAMAAGLPAVSTNVGDASAMVAVENAAFVVPRDDRLFAEALFALVVDRDRRHAIGAANRAQANAKFAIAGMFSAYDELFSGEIARGRH